MAGASGSPTPAQCERPNDSVEGVDLFAAESTGCEFAETRVHA